MVSLVSIQSESEGEVDKLYRLACEKDDILLLKKAMTTASSTNSSQNVLQKSLLQCVRQRSFKLLDYILDQGAHLETIAPLDIVGNKPNQLAEDIKSTLELLELLLARGRDINRIGPLQQNQSPILWHVTDSPILVQWCLDNGSKLTVPEEVTSIDPAEAEIYHTPRHPLLLECVAQYGSVSTFRMLLDKGAPITPGKTWPAIQSPHLLDRAVVGAMQTAPELNQPASIQHKERIDMIVYLLQELGMHVNGKRPFRTSHVLFQDDTSLLHMSRSEDESERDIRDLVDILLDAGADLDDIPIDSDNRGAPKSLPPQSFLVGLDEDTEGYHRSVADHNVLVSPLTRVYLWQPAQFWHAMKLWQQGHAKIDAGSKSSLALQVPPVFQLSKLPNELLGEVGAYLSFSDILAMRLVSRHTSGCMDKAFRHQIRTRRIELRPRVLQDVIDQFTRGGMICHVEEFVLTPRSVYETGYYDLVQELLTKALVASATYGKLHSIQVRNKSKLRRLKDVLDAISSSGIKLRSLILYRGSGMWCVPTYVYIKLDLRSLAQSFKGLKRFYWTLTIDGYRRGNAPESTRTADTGPLALKSISQMLDMMPELEVLDLFWFKKYPTGHAEQYFFNTSYKSILAMKNLRVIGLAGLDFNEASLHQFLKFTNAKRVTLKECRLLYGGQWSSIFGILTSGSFEYFHLAELYEKSARLSFDVPGFKSVRTNNVNSGPSEIIREGREASRQLMYRSSGQITDTNVSVHFEEERARVYGSRNTRDPPIGGAVESP